MDNYFVLPDYHTEMETEYDGDTKSLYETIKMLNVSPLKLTEVQRAQRKSDLLMLKSYIETKGRTRMKLFTGKYQQNNKVVVDYLLRLIDFHLKDLQLDSGGDNIQFYVMVTVIIVLIVLLGLQGLFLLYNNF